MNNLHTTTSPNTTSHPISPTFILHPISPISTVDNESLNDKGIPNRVHVDDPVDEFMIARLPKCIRNPYLPEAGQAFPIFHTSLHQLLPVFSLSLDMVQYYSNPHIYNSLYHIMFSIDAPPILLDQDRLDNPKSFFFYLQQTILSRVYQAYSRPLDWHQMTLIANLAIMSYQNKGMINLLAIQNNMINPRPDSLFSHSTHMLLRHPVAEWLATLEWIQYKVDTI